MVLDRHLENEHAGYMHHFHGSLWILGSFWETENANVARNEKLILILKTLQFSTDKA